MKKFAVGLLGIGCFMTGVGVGINIGKKSIKEVIIIK